MMKDMELGDVIVHQVDPKDIGRTFSSKLAGNVRCIPKIPAMLCLCRHNIYINELT